MTSRLVGYEGWLLQSLKSSAPPSATFYNAPLAVAIIRILQHVGRSASFPVVERLAYGPEETKPQKEIVFAAIKALEPIRARLAGEKDRRSLLRPAEALECEPLLRPAGFLEDNHLDTLVRPADLGNDRCEVDPGELVTIKARRYHMRAPGLPLERQFRDCHEEFRE